MHERVHLHSAGKDTEENAVIHIALVGKLKFVRVKRRVIWESPFYQYSPQQGLEKSGNHIRSQVRGQSDNGAIQPTCRM